MTLPCEVCDKDCSDETLDLTDDGLYACEDCLQETIEEFPQDKLVFTLIQGGKA